MQQLNLKVSSREQGRSGLGPAAQRHEIEAFGSREGFAARSWHQDLQTGAVRGAIAATKHGFQAAEEGSDAYCRRDEILRHR